MKTSEFIKEMHSLGYETTNLERSIIVNDDNGFFLVDVSKERFGVFSTEFAGFYGLDNGRKLQLLDILIKYATTPPEEREDEKRYYLRQIGINEYDNFLNLEYETQSYYVSSNEEFYDYKTQFTQSEIDELPECYKHPAVWEQVRVEEQDNV